MSLSAYRKKRNFTKTSEPKGKVAAKNNHHYLIQKHHASHLHYDLRLELNGVLLSWAVPKGPCLDPSIKRLAIQVEDHPLEYGSFEGIIPKGQYGGGTVMLWDTGTWQCDDPDPVAALKKGHLRFTVFGKKLKGHWNLIKFKTPEDNSWFLIKSKDRYAKPLDELDITLKSIKSAVSKRTMNQIAKQQDVWESSEKTKLPEKVSPQLATLVANVPPGDEWLHEIKFDGYRMLAFIHGKLVKLISRNNKDWTTQFSNVALALSKLNLKNTIIDGEVVLLDKNNKSSFQLLQNAIDSESEQPFIYYAFDLLYHNGKDLMNQPLLKRKDLLKKLIPSKKGRVLRYSDHVIGKGAELFKKSCEMGLEGIISKRIDSRYLQKRGKNWLKIKCSQRQEFFVGGYTQPQGGRQYFGSLFLGYFNKKKEFIFCGNVGTGFNTASLRKIYQSLERSKKNPFNSNPPGHTSATWVKPTLVVEVEFIEWTNEGHLRHPSFKGVRQEVKKEYPMTHPEKLVYPEDKITKQQLAEYYDAIQDWILPHIKNRPLSLVRCPRDYHECFYQKHLNNAHVEHLFSLTESIYIKDFKGLLALVQFGVLEIHPWGSTIKNLEKPDRLTFDLDPSPEVPWKKVVKGAQLIREHLLDYQLESFIKTTGGKGLHVVVPIKPEYSWNEIKIFAHTFVDFLVLNHPKEYVSNMSKAKRVGKIFLDYLRNQRGATSVAAYSTRARNHAPVSAPIAWDELTNNIKDTSFNILTLPERLAALRQDPWANFFKIKQSLRLNKL